MEIDCGLFNLRIVAGNKVNTQGPKDRCIDDVIEQDIRNCLFTKDCQINRQSNKNRIEQVNIVEKFLYEQEDPKDATISKAHDKGQQR